MWHVPSVQPTLMPHASYCPLTNPFPRKPVQAPLPPTALTSVAGVPGLLLGRREGGRLSWDFSLGC